MRRHGRWSLCYLLIRDLVLPAKAVKFPDTWT